MAVAEPPIQPAAPPAAPETLKSPPASVTVTPETIERGKPLDTPKAGTARDRLFNKVRDSVPGAETPKTKLVEPPDKDAPKPSDKAEPKTDTKTVESPKEDVAAKEKVSPWKLKEQWQAKAAELEKQLADIKSSTLTEAERKSIAERAEKAEARAKQLEDEIRFVAYEKSPEFQKQYQEPYEKAWKEAVTELGQIPIVNPETGEKRYATSHDLSALMGMSLEDARKVADSNFGAFANDVMAYRKDVLKLFNARSNALEEGRKAGAERERKMAEEATRAETERANSVRQTWEKANKEALSHEQYGKYFVPVEGDQQINDRLAKGYKLVDRAFNENAMDPGLSAEERAGVIKRQAAVRNRAAAFGRLVYQNQQLEAKLAEAQKELEGFKSSDPDTAGTAQNGSPAPAYTSATEKLHAAIRNAAK